MGAGAGAGKNKFIKTAARSQEPGASHFLERAGAESRWKKVPAHQHWLDG